MSTISKERLLDTKARTKLHIYIPLATANSADTVYYVHIPYECLLTGGTIAASEPLGTGQFKIEQATLVSSIYSLPEDLSPVTAESILIADPDAVLETVGDTLMFEATPYYPMSTNGIEEITNKTISDSTIIPIDT